MKYFRMKLLLVCFTLWCLQDTKANITHVNLQLSGCTEVDKEFIMGHDGEELMHVDFNKGTVVKSTPDFIGNIDWTGAYEVAVSLQKSCRNNLYLSIDVYESPPEELDPPLTSIYLEDEVQLDSENTLICLSARFFPPPVRIRWTKNGKDVTNSATLSQFYPNKDRTYNQFSHLPFTPQDGDVYTCTVEHKALQNPDTKIWSTDVDVDVDVEHPSVGPAVFCGVGSVVGLIGVATGAFFFIKGNRCNS